MFADVAFSVVVMLSVPRAPAEVILQSGSVELVCVSQVTISIMTES